MCQAALQYARRGWPVFPCREHDGDVYQRRNRKGELEDHTPRAKQPYVTTGLKAATTDEEQIKRWWKQWPHAMIGLPLGAVTRQGDSFFALDFDPRIDAETGEEFTLEKLKVALEAQMGCALPGSLSVRTPSGGVHVYLKQPKTGDEIRNRGNLPDHVDVRGRGGYVIAPPSRIVEPSENASVGQYRWLHGRVDEPVADAPDQLVQILRDRGRRPTSDTAAQSPRPRPSGDQVDDAVRKYGLSALDGECRLVRSAGSGKRNAQLNESAFAVATLVAAGAIDAGIARSSLEAAARDNPGRDSDAQLTATIDSGWTAGIAQPRDLEEIAAAARDRASRSRSSPRSSLPPPAPGSTSNGKPSSQAGGSSDKVASEGVRGQDRGRLAPDQVRECAFLPLTDLGNLERFLKRFGADFLNVEAWGWLAWDGKRWNRDMALPLLGAAVHKTMRAIQDEAALIRESGVPFPPDGGFLPEGEGSDDDDEDERLFKGSKTGQKERRVKNHLWLQQRHLARLTGGDGPRLRLDRPGEVEWRHRAAQRQAGRLGPHLRRRGTYQLHRAHGGSRAVGAAAGLRCRSAAAQPPEWHTGVRAARRRAEGRCHHARASARRSHHKDR